MALRVSLVRSLVFSQQDNNEDRRFIPKGSKGTVVDIESDNLIAVVFDTVFAVFPDTDPDPPYGPITIQRCRVLVDAVDLVSAEPELT